MSYTPINPGNNEEIQMTFVAVESPYAGDIEANQAYLSACLRDCLLRGEAPFASHAIYTREGVLDDSKPEERVLGMLAGKVIEQYCKKTVVYIDRGISSGMKWGIERAEQAGREIEYRALNNYIKQGETP